jgi:wyosine [tRNA(Phe)-imidazoG37] synthetase (radical SAM superfamily)
MKASLAKLALFTQHSRLWEGNRYVYPVLSRRSKGLSIGVNLNPDKACNFDCVYCCVDRKQPAAVREVDLDVLGSELDAMLGMACSGEIWRSPPFDATPPELRRLNDVAFSGDGEPTAFKGFGEACRLAVELIEKHGAGGTKIVVITNATLLDRPRVVEALEYLDRHNGEIWAKLDAGTEAYYQLVERTKIPLQRVLDNIVATGRVRPIVIQSLFMRISGAGPNEQEVGEYVRRLTELVERGCRIKLVQVYTVARGTAEAYVTPLDDREVDAIAAKAAAAGLAVESHYGPT